MSFEECIKWCTMFNATVVFTHELTVQIRCNLIRDALGIECIEGLCFQTAVEIARNGTKDYVKEVQGDCG